MIRSPVRAAGALVLSWLLLLAELSAQPLLRDGDRVVLLGNALFERAQSNGATETLLTQIHVDARIRFRNLGWSGDDTRGLSRAGFGSPQHGFQELLKQVRSADPTVLVLGYGLEDSWDGDEGVLRFKTGLSRLLEALGPHAARLALVSPPRHEKLAAPFPDPTEHNVTLEQVRDVLAATAQSRNAVLIDFFGRLPDGRTVAPYVSLTENGIHLTSYGYWRSAQTLATELGLELPSWRVDVDVVAGRIEAAGSGLDQVEISPARVAFRALDRTLPLAAPPLVSEPPGSPARRVEFDSRRTLRVGGLKEGEWSLTIDGQEIETASAETWRQGVALERGPEFAQVERLRDAIVLKNYLYFMSWRPQNNTYLFLFRKHEQGDLAGEIDDFEPLILAKESEIDRLKRPLRHTYVLELAANSAEERR